MCDAWCQWGQHFGSASCVCATNFSNVKVLRGRACFVYFIMTSSYMQPVALNQLGESVIIATISERTAKQERSHKVRGCVLCVYYAYYYSVCPCTHSLTHTHNTRIWARGNRELSSTHGHKYFKRARDCFYLMPLLSAPAGAHRHKTKYMWSFWITCFQNNTDGNNFQKH